MQRRTLFRWSAAVAVVAAAATATHWSLQARPNRPALLKAVAAAVLEGLLPAQPARALDEWAQRFHVVVQGLPPAVQAELDDLLMLMDLAPGRLLLCGQAQDWRGLTPADLRVRLQAMRESGVSLRQQAYHALRDLTHAAYFAHPGTWAAIGYEGPVAV